MCLVLWVLSTDKACALQDLDINFQLLLNAATYDQLMGQLGRDCALLESLRVMDYSLLLGVHYLSWGADEWIAPQIKVGRSKPGPAHATHAQQACCGLDRWWDLAAMMLTWKLWNNGVTAGCSVVDLGCTFT